MHRTKRIRKTPKQTAIEWAKRSKDPDGFGVDIYGYKGRGIKTLTKRVKGDFLLHYCGEVITGEEGEKREEEESSGYRFFYILNGRQLCVDATEESGRLGRLVNHGTKKEINTVMKETDGFLILFAIRDIKPGEELLYDYGLKDLPWNKIPEKQDKIVEKVSSSLETSVTNKSNNPVEETDSADKSNNPIEETDSADKSNIPVEETDSADKSNIPVEETDSADKSNIPVKETDRADKSNIPIEESDSADKSDNPVEEIDCVDKSKIPVEETDKSKNPVEETDSADKSINPVEETDSADKSNNPVEETDSADKSNNPVEETDCVDKSNNPVEETDCVDKSNNPVEETDCVDKSNNPVEETDSADKSNIPVEETDSADKSNNPVEETDSADKSNDPIEETDSADKSNNPVEETDSADKSNDPIEETDSADKSNNPVEETDSADKSNNPVEETDSDDKSNNLVEETDSADKSNNLVEETDSADKSNNLVEETDSADKSNNLFEETDSADKSNNLVEETDSADKSNNLVEETDSADKSNIPIEETDSADKSNVGGFKTKEWDTMPVESEIRNQTNISVSNTSESSEGQFWGSVIVVKGGVFPMCSTLLAIGSAQTNDIIVKKATPHEVLIEVNLFGEIFLIDSSTQSVKQLEDNDLFVVGGHEFRWKYPLKEAPMVFDLPETEHRKESTSESIPVISPATQTAISLPNFEQNAEELSEDVTFRCPFGETLPSNLSEPEGGNGDLLKPLPVSCPAVEVETSSSTLAQNPECLSEDFTVSCPYGETLPSDLSGPEGGNGDLLKTLPVLCPAVEVETSSSTLAQNPECLSEDFTVSDPYGESLPSNLQNGDGNTTKSDSVSSQTAGVAICLPYFVQNPGHSSGDFMAMCPSKETFRSSSPFSEIDGAETSQTFKDLNLTSSAASSWLGFVGDSEDNIESDVSEEIPCLTAPGADVRNLEKKYAKLKKKYSKLIEKYKMVPAAATHDSEGNKGLETIREHLTDINAADEQVAHDAGKKRKYDKLLACVFCGKLYKHRITEHFYCVHKNEMEVAKALGTSNKRKRENMFLKLKNKGNFKHNVKFLQNGGHTFIVCKRPCGCPVIPDDYLPCVYCFGFYQRMELWRHVMKCPSKSGSKTVKRVAIQAASKVMLRSAVTPDPKGEDGQRLLELLKTRNDDIGHEVVQDTLIIKFGKVLYEKLGGRRKHDVSQRMRQLARLKTQVNSKKENKIGQLFDIISGKEFDSVVQAVKDIAGMYENEEDVVRFEKPGLALRLGHNLIKVADIKFGMCLRNDDGVGTSEAETFSKLYRGEWNDLVSAVALASLKTNKFNKGDVMPLTDDLVQLKNHLSSKMATMSERIKDVPSYQTWRQLAEATMVRILLLNKRRGAEASKLLLTSYQKRPDWKETTNKEVLNSMSPLERKMFSRVDMVQTQGKMNKKVTTLLTNDMVKAVDLLITFRTQSGVNESNKYVFANQHEGHLDTWQTLRELAVQAGCKKPELINSNSLRKYIATVCQIMDLNEGEVQWVSTHLAHTVKTHLGFYRLQEAAIEIGKVSRLLLAAENGTLSKYKGKSLEDIQVDDLPLEPTDVQEVGEEDSIDNEIAETNADGFEQSVVDNGKGHKQPRGKPESDSEDEQSATREMPRCKRPRLSQSRHILESDSEDEQSATREMPRCKRPRLSQSRHILESDSEDFDSDNSLCDPTFKKTKVVESSEDERPQRKKMYKQRWTQEENKIFMSIFAACVKGKHMPTATTLRLAAKQLPLRTVAQIRTRVHNIISGKQVMII